MTNNQIKYWQLNEDARHNRAMERYENEKAKAATDTAAAKKHDVKWKYYWEPIKDISDNIAKVLGGLL
jgi:hypothetical protein